MMTHSDMPVPHAAPAAGLPASEPADAGLTAGRVILYAFAGTLGLGVGAFAGLIIAYATGLYQLFIRC